MTQLTLIIPCFNEEKRLKVQEYIDYSKDNEIIFCFVNDGSNDNTDKIINEIILKTKNNFKITLNKNFGKAEAVRQGIITLLNTQNFQFVGYWDADLAAPLTDIKEFINKFKSNKELKAVCGSRILRLGSSIRRSVFRHYIGRIFATVVSNMLKIPVYDTQCGAKIFSSRICRIYFFR